MKIAACAGIWPLLSNSDSMMFKNKYMPTRLIHIILYILIDQRWLDVQCKRVFLLLAKVLKVAFVHVAYHND